MWVIHQNDDRFAKNSYTFFLHIFEFLWNSTVINSMDICSWNYLSHE